MKQQQSNTASTEKPNEVPAEAGKEASANATSVTKVDEPAEGDAAAADDSGKSDDSEASDAKKDEGQKADESKEEPSIAAKKADPIAAAPATKFLKADDEILEEEEKPAIAEADLVNNEELMAKFLVNPSKVLSDIKNSAVAEVRKSLQDENNAKTAWRNFYTENKDLEHVPELVQMVTNRLHAQWKREGNVPSWQDGSKTLAKEVRKLVSKVRASDSDIEAVNTESKAAVVSSSGNPAPRGVMKPAERRGFVDQVRAMQEKKGKLA